MADVFKNLFEERMPIKTSMVETIKYYSYFINTGIFAF